MRSMRSTFLFALASIVVACGSGSGQGSPTGMAGGPNAFGQGESTTPFGNGSTAPTFGENASGPAFGENEQPGPAFDENGGFAPSFGSRATTPSSPGQQSFGDPTKACKTSADCAAGDVCNSGYCIRPCSLPEGTTVGTSTCPAPYVCISPTSGGGACVRTCASSASCPSLAGFTALCATAKGVAQSFCIWTKSSTATPSGG